MSDKTLSVTTAASWTDDAYHELNIRRGTSISVIQVEMPPAVAAEIAAYLEEKLTPYWAAQCEREEARYRAYRERDDAERAARKPEEDRKAAELAAAAAKAPRVSAVACPDCGHVDHPETFAEEATYECGSCGTTGRGEEGRRCDQCHKFCAKATDFSCPSCETGLESLDEVLAADLGNELVEVPE